ncbi:unnamed protein product [Caenorhabditis bovis]|uniref:non-specific serine/threonine protein kinase n=1 Tax=Caenorhabditis bovis TaxID=2654633 RepID=A0A8S1EMC1_9PELO|nr:unnamed protein product [Caenorhabditis bovis]
MKRVSNVKRQWRLLQRRIKLAPTVILENDRILFQSADDGARDASFGTRTKKNQAKAKKKKKKAEIKAPPVIGKEDIEVSSDEGEGNALDKIENDENEDKLKELCKLQQSIDDFSMIIIKNGVRQKIVDGKMVVHDQQPKWAKALRENEDDDNDPTDDDEAQIEEIMDEQEKAYQKLRQTIIHHENRERKRQEQSNDKTFQVFSQDLLKSLNSQQNKDANDTRLSIFNYTPIRGNRINKSARLASVSTLMVFSPCLDQVSTPIEKNSNAKPSNLKQLEFSCSSVFPENDASTAKSITKCLDSTADDSDEPMPYSSRPSCSTAVEIQQEDQTLKAQSPEMSPTTPPVEKRQLRSSAASQADANTAIEPTMEAVVESRLRGRSAAKKSVLASRKSARKSEKPPPAERIDDDGGGAERKSPRPADSSITEALVSSGDEDKRTRKKRRTGEDESDKENGPDECPQKGGLQPQKQQLQREARMSTATVASSRRDSIQSLLEEVSLDDFLGDNATLGGSMMKSYLSRNQTKNITGITESRAQTAMTVMIEDPSIVPFYIADLSLGLHENDMKQLLHILGQQAPINWKDMPKTMFMPSKVKKLGEGSYGEVFATTYEQEPIALKIVPFEPDAENRLFDGEVNGGEMPSSGMLIPEIVVSKELSGLRNLENDNATPNFIQVVAINVVQGFYPNGLLKAWDAYAQKKESLNDRPSDYSSDEQCFATFAFENGGSDLESFKFKSENEIRSVLIQLMLSLTVAETEIEFEHRDLHLGNVLVCRKQMELRYKLNGSEMSVRSHGVKASIIDFTLSRMKKNGATVYQDLQNQDIFDGEGDEQFEIYRRMRDNNGNDWSKFHSCTNLWWVQYLAKKMIEPPICPKGVLTAKRKKELGNLFARLGEFGNCRQSFADAEFYSEFFKGFIQYH